MALDDLFDAAKKVQANAHVPYSRFKVGAAIRTPSGAVYAGCNVENAAYPVGNCAEASAIASMVGHGETSIADILVIGPGEALCFPCGACRQRIREFAGPQTRIHMWNANGTARETFTMEELLPRSFGPGDLGF
jgi:cytidine deaminase